MRVAIISGYPLCREALARLAQSELRPEQLDVYGGRAEFAEASPIPDLLLFDPAGGGLAAEIIALAETAGRCVAMVLIPEPDVPLARLARRHGFRGVLPKTFELPVVAAALRLVVAGGEYFPCFDLEESAPAPVRTAMSRRQAEILVELEAGATNKEIARKFGISLTTVKMHVRALLNLVGARNRTEAVMRLRRTP